MNWLKSKKVRWLLGIVAGLILIAGVSGFALTRGYLMHFVVDEQTISRDAYYQLAGAPLTDDSIHMYCTSGAALGFVYLWDVHCYSSEAALDAYMGI